MSRYKWVIVAVFCVAVTVQAGLYVVSMVDSIHTIADLNSLPVIIIDPGHPGDIKTINLLLSIT